MSAKFDETKKVKVAKRPSAKDEIVLAGIEQYAAVDAAIAKLTELRAAMSADLRGGIIDRAVDHGVKTGDRPSNFVGVEGQGRASMELKKRSSTSGLTSEEVELLSSLSIPVQETVSTVDTFVLNPVYRTDKAMLRRVERALKGKKMIPRDLFLKQDGVSSMVVTDESMAAVFGSKDADTIKNALPIVAITAIRPSIADLPLGELLSLIGAKKTGKPAK